MSADVHMLSGAYAVDAVDDPTERRLFEDHLDECEACRVEVRSLRGAVVALGDAAAVPPPRSLRSRVMHEISMTPQVVDRAPRPARVGRPAPVPVPTRRSALRVAAAAAVFVIGGGGLAGGAVELLRARQTNDQADRVLSIAADPTARRVTGAVRGGGTATVIVAGSQAALVADGVPGLASGRTYQLWLVRPGQIVSAGLGPAGGAAAGRWNRLITGVRTGDQVAISIEPDGGSPQPTTTPLTVIKA